MSGFDAEKIKSFLRRLEWSGEHGSCLECRACPRCDRTAREGEHGPDPQRPPRRPLEPQDLNHREDCALAKAIAELEKA